MGSDGQLHPVRGVPGSLRAASNIFRFCVFSFFEVRCHDKALNQSPCMCVCVPSAMSCESRSRGGDAAMTAGLDLEDLEVCSICKCISFIFRLSCDRLNFPTRARLRMSMMVSLRTKRRMKMISRTRATARKMLQGPWRKLSLKLWMQPRSRTESGGRQKPRAKQRRRVQAVYRYMLHTQHSIANHACMDGRGY